MREKETKLELLTMKIINFIIMKFIFFLLLNFIVSL